MVSSAMLFDSTATAPRGAEQVFEELHDRAFLIDPKKGRFIGANLAACDFLGYDASELQQLTPADVHPHEIPRLAANHGGHVELLRTGTDGTVFRLVLPDPPDSTVS